MKRSCLLFFFSIYSLTYTVAQQPLLLPCPVGDKWGYCDTNGIMVIPAQFDKAWYFTQKIDQAYDHPLDIWYAPVFFGSYQNWIDAKGNLIFHFDSIRKIECYPINERLLSLSLAFTKQGMGFYLTALVDKHLEVIRPFEAATYQSQKRIFDYGNDLLLEKKISGEYVQGIVNANGETLIEPKFGQISNIYKRHYFAHLPDSARWILYEMPEKMVDTLPLNYYPLTGIHDGLIGVYTYIKDSPGQNCGFVDVSGKVLVPLNYKRIEAYKYGIALAQRQDDGWDILDKKGRVRMQISEYEHFIRYSEHFFIWKDSSRWQGYTYDFHPFLKSTISAPPKLLLCDGNPCYLVKMGSDSVYVNLAGKELGRHPYELIQIVPKRWNEELPPGLFHVLIKGKWGLAQRISPYRYQEICAALFDYPPYLHKNLIAGSIDKKAGVIDLSGKVILSFEWDAVGILNDHVKPDSIQISVLRNGRKGIYSKDGKILVPCVIRNHNYPITIGNSNVWLDTLAGNTYVCDGKGDCAIFDSSYLFPEYIVSGVKLPGLIVEKDTKSGILNAAGEWILQPIWYTCNISENGKYLTGQNADGSFLWETPSGELLGTVSSGSINFNRNDVVFQEWKDGVMKYGVWLEKEKRFVYADPYADPKIHGLRKKRENNRTGFINENLEFVIPPVYESAEHFSDGTSVVKFDGLYGVIDTLGNQVIPISYSTVKRLKNNYFMLKKDSLNGWALLNDRFQVMYKNAYHIDTFPHNRLIITLWNNTKSVDSVRYVVMDDSGNILADQPEQIFNNKEGLAYMKDGRYFEHGVSEDEPLKLIYSIGKTMKMHDSLLWVGISTHAICYDYYGISGILKKDGTPLIPIARQYISEIKFTSDFLVCRDGRCAIFDSKGHQRCAFEFESGIQYDLRVPFCYYSTIKDPSDNSKFTDWWISRSGRRICIKQ